MPGILRSLIQFFIVVRYRAVIVVLLALGLPIYLYLAFWAKDPVFTPENDVALGQQSAASIAADPEQFPVLSEEESREAYAETRRIAATVVGSPEIQYRDLFAYDQVKIIDDDDTLNAFCTPGGFIYVYTGLIRYLDAEDHLAGVLGHEIAHAERRHSSSRLQKQFGVNALLAFVVLGTPISLADAINAQILAELMTLRYSRGQEAQSDDDSVRYLASTPYACDGAAGFFEKLLNEGQDVRVPAFLSDHPDSASRVADIRARAEALGCSTAIGDQSRWNALKAGLPTLESGDEETPESSAEQG